MSVTDAGGGAWPTTVELTRLFSNSISTSENRLTTPTLGTIKYFTRQAFFFFKFPQELAFLQHECGTKNGSQET